MGIFNFFKTPEEIFYKKISKIVKKINRNKKNTISNLRVNVMTLNNSLVNLNKQLDEKNNTLELNFSEKLFEEIKILKLKIKVLEDLLKNAEENFVEGVKIKLKELGYDEVPDTYEKCNKLSLRVEAENWFKRRIASEQIKNLKIK